MTSLLESADAEASAKNVGCNHRINHSHPAVVGCRLCLPYNLCRNVLLQDHTAWGLCCNERHVSQYDHVAGSNSRLCSGTRFAEQS